MKIHTELIVALDQSGSMNKYQLDVMDGYKQFMNEQRKINQDIYVSLYQFSDDVRRRYFSTPIKEIPPLKYDPSGQTSLYDAVGMAINDMSLHTQDTLLNGVSSRVLMAILTDGKENNSRQFTKDHLWAMIRERIKFGWEFVFIGKGDRVAEQAIDLGIKTDNIKSFERIGEAFRLMSDTTSKLLLEYKKCQNDTIIL